MIRRLKESDYCLKNSPLAEEFYAGGFLTGNFNAEHFFPVAQAWVKHGIAAGFGRFVDDRMVGTIFGLSYIDPYTGRKAAQCLLWFVHPEFRGDLESVRLFDHFEEWSREFGAEKVDVTHLLGSMPPKVKEFFNKRGYVRVEEIYRKSNLKSD